MPEWEAEEEVVEGELTLTDANGNNHTLVVNTFLWTFDKRSIYEKIADLEGGKEKDE